jgi:RNA polymerase sigma factor (TIGR02999 family)
MATATSTLVTNLLIRWSQGETAALEQLIPHVHRELRRIAHRYMAGERGSHTLQTTALVNEAYLRLIDVKNMQVQDRAHFFALSAQMMRRILVDFARARRYQKRGGGAPVVPLESGFVAAPERGRDLLALDAALEGLRANDERKTKVVEMRFFGGLSNQEIAGVLGVSVETVQRDWKLSKAWLARELAAPARSSSRLNSPAKSRITSAKSKLSAEA